MLEEIYIKDFALIKELRLSLGAGLNLITGETGAGKSIILGALNLLLGSKATTDLIRSGTSRAFVEGRFDISKNKQIESIKKILFDQGLESEDSFLSLKREINIDGRGRSFINSFQVPVGLLKDIGSYLLDIHGQNEHQNILKPGIHLSILDQYAHVKEDLKSYLYLYEEYIKNEKKLQNFSLNEQEKKRRIEILKHEIEEIENAKLTSDKDFEDLLNEEKILSNAEVLKNTILENYHILKSSEHSILPQVSKIRKKIGDIIDYDTSLIDLSQKVDDVFYLLDDLAVVFRNYIDQVVINAEDLEVKRNKIDLIQNLLRKYGNDIKNILEYLQKAKDEYENINFSSEEEENIKLLLQELLPKLRIAAQNISIKRRKAAEDLEKKIYQELIDLGMGDSLFKINLKWEEDLNGLYVAEQNNSQRYHLYSTGLDLVEFFIASSKDEVLRPIRKIASGGEMSRIMLSLKKVIIDSDPVSTMIFDEVDTGVGGRIAEAIGKKLASLANNAQVIVITHLHQIASISGDKTTHFKVMKDLITGTKIKQLNDEQRIEEVARMLGGEEITNSALEHARTLLKN